MFHTFRLFLLLLKHVGSMMLDFLKLHEPEGENSHKPLQQAQRPNFIIISVTDAALLALVLTNDLLLGD